MLASERVQLEQKFMRFCGFSDQRRNAEAFVSLCTLGE